MPIKKALIIDDSPLARLTLKRYLQKANIDVLEADSFINARYWLWKTPLPDVVFMDISMPNIDGFEGLAEIRQREESQHLPVIMYSGDHSQDAKLRAKNEGATGYLRKPVDTTHLQLLLERLDERQQQKQEQTDHNAHINNIHNKGYAELRRDIEQINLILLEQRSEVTNLETVAQRQSNDINYLHNALQNMRNRAQKLKYTTFALAVLIVLGAIFVATSI